MKSGPRARRDLNRIYKLFTSLPGSSRGYTPTDFARDLYLLDTSGLTSLKSGATVSFPASTGTRSARGLFTFIGRTVGMSSTTEFGLLTGTNAEQNLTR